MPRLRQDRYVPPPRCAEVREALRRRWAETEKRERDGSLSRFLIRLEQLHRLCTSGAFGYCAWVRALVHLSWSRRIGEDDALVLHTLVIDPSSSGNGYGTRFVRFYEELAASYGIHDLRMDTNERNQRARRLYARLGYREAGIIPTVFNGIEGVGLVLLEKLI